MPKESLNLIDEKFVTNEDSIEQNFNYNPLYTGLHLNHDHGYTTDNGHNHEDTNSEGLSSSTQQRQQHNRLIESNNNNNNNAANMQSCDTHNVLEDLFNYHNSDRTTSRTSDGHQQNGKGQQQPGGSNNDQMDEASDENNVNNKQQQHCQSLEFAQHQQRRQQHSHNIDHSESKLPQANTRIEEQNNQQVDCTSRNLLLQHPQQQIVSFASTPNTQMYGSAQYNQVTSELQAQCQTSNSARQRRRNMIEQQQDGACNNVSSQQRPYMLATGVDASEEIFSDYQNGRVSLGMSEELQQLNHSINCDNESIEEQINMLSNEDFMGSTNVDQMDYNNFASNDQFLNMLFSGPNNQLNCTPINTSSNNLQQQLNGQLSNGSGAKQQTHNLIQTPGTGSNKTPDGCMQNSSSINPSHKQQQDRSALAQTSQRSSNQSQDTNQNKSQSQVKNISSKQTKAKNTPKNRKNVSNASASNKGFACNETSDPKNSTKHNKKSSSRNKSGSTNRPQQQQNASGTQVNSLTYSSGNNESDTELRITTSNTNKRLMPKKTASNPRSCSYNNLTALRRDTYVNSSCVTSPTSTSNTSNSSILSPTSSNNTNQLAEHENSYKVQLDNLRKKLKMDVAPAVVSSQASQVMDKNRQQLSSPVTLIAPQTSDISANQIQDVNTYHSQQRHQMPVQVLVRNDAICNNQSLQVQTTNCSLTRFRSTQQQSLSNQTHTTDTLHIHKQSPMGAATNNNSPTYVIAKPEPPDTNQGCNGGGTIYLSTSSGLMQVTQAQHNPLQQTSVSGYSVSGQISHPIPLSAPLIFGCLNQTRTNCQTKGPESQGPTGIMYQQPSGSSQTHTQPVATQRQSQQSIQTSQTVPGTTQELIFSGEDDIKSFVDASTESQNLIRNIQNSEPQDRLQHGINII